MAGHDGYVQLWMARGLVLVIEDAVEIAIYQRLVQNALFGQDIIKGDGILSCQQGGNRQQHTKVATIIARQVQHEVLHFGVGGSLVQRFHDAANVTPELRVVGRQRTRTFIIGRPGFAVYRSEIVKDTVHRVANLSVRIRFQQLLTFLGGYATAVVSLDVRYD